MNITPEPRIGDHEREAAAVALGEHYAAGRLDKDEYDERCAQAWAARTNADLRPLFVDLPAPQRTLPPGAPGAAHDLGPGRQPQQRRRLPVLPLAALVLVLLVLLPFPVWLALGIAAVWWFAGCRSGWAGARRPDQQHRSGHR